MVRKLRSLLEEATEEERVEVSHVFEYFAQKGLAKQAVKDKDWIPTLRDEGWVVIAVDRAKKKGGSHDGKLPSLCMQYGVTHVLLSRRVGQRRNFQKMLTILSVWHEMVEKIHAAIPGTRFFIEPVSMDFSTAGRGKLIKKKEPKEGAPKGMLFNPDAPPQ
jgi:hypothetical protein